MERKKRIPDADGRVLIAGGTGADGPLATAELYDGGGFFTSTTPMHVARAKHAAVVLQDGRVLVAGGASTGGDATKTAEIYDPAAADWSIGNARVSTRKTARLAMTATNAPRATLASPEPAPAVRLWSAR